MDHRKPHPKFAKLSPPRLPKVVARPRLYRQLDTLRRHHTIIWIAAPPGMGKTTLAASYVKAREIKPVWYQIDEGDRDPATLFYFLGLAYQHYAPRTRAKLPHFTLEYLKNLTFFSRTFFQRFYARLKQPAVVVWDNVQDVLWEKDFPDWVLNGLYQVPEGITLLVLSREDPPPSLTRGRANQEVGVIRADDLRFTPKEAQGFLTLQQRPTKRQMTRAIPQEWLEKLQGWPAGLLLLLEHLKRTGLEDVPGDLLFDYWAQEVLGQLPTQMQEGLCQLSVLPYMTGSMAQVLTGQTQAEKWLSDLSRRRYFTERRGEVEPVYQFHSLFQEFLYHQALQRFSEPEWAIHQVKAARLIEAHGDIDKARNLFAEANHQDDVCRLILSQAPRLVAEGRTELLLSWMDQLPQVLRAQSPWLMFWQGTCQFGVKMDLARSAFHQAFQEFKVLRDEMGIVLTWAGLVETIFWSWDGMEELEPFIKEFEALFPQEYVAPNQAVEFRMTCGMFSAYMWKRPDHPNMAYWEQRAAKLFAQITDATQLIVLGNTLLIYYHWIGQEARQMAVYSRVCRQTSHVQWSPLSRIILDTMEVLQGVARLDRKKLLASSERLEACLQEIGAPIVAFPQLISGKITAHLLAGNNQQASQIIQEQEEEFLAAPALKRGFYLQLKGQVAFHQRQFEEARMSHTLALQSCYDAGVPYPMAVNHLCLAFLEGECRNVQQAHEHIETGLGIASGIGSVGLESIAYLATAFAALKEGRPQEIREALHHAMKLGREYGFVEIHWFMPRILATLCGQALQEGIEVDFVQSLIRKRHLQPEDPPLSIQLWPWDVRITTLGAFGLEVGGVPVQFGRKVPKRVVALLQAIIAFGGKEVSELRIMDVLWPEADGDRAYWSYATTLHRLRKLLGEEKAIVVKDSKVTLDPYRCWVDVWAYEALLEQAAVAEHEGDTTTRLERCDRALHHYQGPFLPDQNHAAWATRTRERLRKKYVTHVEKLCQAWSHDGKVQEARDLFNRAIEHVPDIESLVGKIE